MMGKTWYLRLEKNSRVGIWLLGRIHAVQVRWLHFRAPHSHKSWNTNFLPVILAPWKKMDGGERRNLEVLGLGWLTGAVGNEKLCLRLSEDKDWHLRLLYDPYICVNHEMYEHKFKHTMHMCIPPWSKMEIEK